MVQFANLVVAQVIRRVIETVPTICPGFFLWLGGDIADAFGREAAVSKYPNCQCWVDRARGAVGRSSPREEESRRAEEQMRAHRRQIRRRLRA